MRLTEDEIIRSKDEYPLELFRQGMQAVLMREKYEMAPAQSGGSQKRIL